MCAMFGVVQRRQDLRFPLESREAIGIVGERLRQDFHYDVAIERRIARPDTSPMPPAPMADRISYGLSVAPVVSTSSRQSAIQSEF